MPDTGLDGTSQTPLGTSITHDQSYEQTFSTIHNDEDAIDHTDEPPLKKRKVADSGADNKSLFRPISPPWKRIVAEGPTSFVENGRRKSGRTNAVPLELQPQSGKRQTRAAFDKVVEDKNKQSRPLYSMARKYNSNDPRARRSMSAGKPAQRGPGRPPKYPRSPLLTKAQPVKLEPVSPKHSKHSPSQLRSQLKQDHNQHRQQLPKQSARYERPTSIPSIDGQSEWPPTNGHVTGDRSDEEESNNEASSRSPSPPTIQKIRFVVRLPKPSVASPSNIPLPKMFASFEDFLDRDELEPRHGQDLLSPEQVSKEAMARRRVREARKPGRPLDKKLLKILPDRQNEPRKQYAHHDHFLAHVSHFAKLLKAEQKDHIKRAEIIAHEAKKFVESRRRKAVVIVKTPEEIKVEQIAQVKGAYAIVMRDLDKQWMAVEAEVNELRLRQWEEEQAARLKKRLNRVLDRTDEMLDASMRRDSSVVDSAGGDSEAESENSDTESSEDEQNMSNTETSDSEGEAEDVDANMSDGELQRKYANLPSPPDAPRIKEANQGSLSDNDVDMSPAASHSHIQSSDVDDDTDPSTEMDSEFDSDSEDDEENEENSEDEEEDESSGNGLLGLLFSKREMADLAPEADDKGVSDAVAEDGDEMEISHVQEDLGKTEEASAEVPPLPKLLALIENASPEARTSREPSTQASPNTSATKASEPESVSSLDPRGESQIPPTPAESKSHLKTPIPSLLRGTLREYQHEGLDWLADLYAKGRNGILADEMGLGKTIQSIALLAHLAVEHEVWGPHLIVVPTSVMLNWEMEFKKFCPGFKVLTYYGNQEERKQKRRGWMTEDSFNVCITSYQLVLQDQNSFKRRKWHYMILDEAHNIKNFRSDRWQTMMTFNTRARLLLTGTPLQNNLTELWSLLYFLHYGQDTDSEEDGFAGLKDFSEWFKSPVDSILEHGRQVLSEEDKESVTKLHKVIRPFLLRRLKADVEKQMPLKYEHVELCRLSKRQRQLYDGFMSRAQTKETLASGNYLSIINALMQLRKVCNHPDLFETRPINTSFAMSKSIAAEFEIRDLIVRRKMLENNDAFTNLNLDFLDLVPISREDISAAEVIDSLKLLAYSQFKRLRDIQWERTNRQASFTGSNTQDVLTSLENVGRNCRLQEFNRTLYFESYRHRQRPIYGRGLLQKLSFGTTHHRLSHLSGKPILTKSWESESPISSLNLIQSIQTRSDTMEPLIQKYACITPAVITSDLTAVTVPENITLAIRREQAGHAADPFHEARMKLSIAFPDKRLLQYDCGKLQRLALLLRDLQAGGHRALIFTQMTKVLDILEQFLNIHGHRYLRLDGATKIEQRQILTDRFNNDTRILAFILSSRSGGLGINLTGADTVIFYDLDWNPAMDKQCTDRAHRIGQTRDVHIYRFVSEHTIESNILRKANQKQMLDDVVIQEGDFTTDYFNKVSYRDMLAEEADVTDVDAVASLAMDRVLGNDRAEIAAFEQAEDKEDIVAAKVAAREIQHADDGDFEDKIAVASTTPRTAEAETPGAVTNAPPTEAGDDDDNDDVLDVDEFMLRTKQWLLKDVPISPPKEKKKSGRRPGPTRKKGGAELMRPRRTQ